MLYARSWQLPQCDKMPKHPCPSLLFSVRRGHACYVVVVVVAAALVCVCVWNCQQCDLCGRCSENVQAFGKKTVFWKPIFFKSQSETKSWEEQYRLHHREDRRDRSLSLLARPSLLLGYQRRGGTCRP